MSDSHYDFLGLDMAATDVAIMSAVEQLSKQANALANVDPERSHSIRSRLRQIRGDLLSGPERRGAYDLYLQSMQSPGTPDETPLTAAWSGPAATPPPRSTAPPEYGTGNGSMPPTRPPSRRNVYWIAALVVLVLAGLAAAVGVALARGHAPQPTATPLPTATPVPPTPTVAPPTARPTQTPDPATAVRAALQRSNQAYVASMNCACDAGLETVKIDPDLRKYLDQIQQMQSQGVHHAITTNSFSVDSVQIESPTSASATVSKDETDQTYTNGTLTSTCQGPYRVQYHLQLVGGTWKVDNSSVLPNSSRACS